MRPRKMMGFESPGDQRIPVSVRDWSAVKLALWRSKWAWEIAARAASEILERCRHSDGCPAITIDSAPCIAARYEVVDGKSRVINPGCPDREARMSALVILTAARQFAPVSPRRPASESYMAPSREYFSEVLADLAVAEAQLEALRASGIEVPSPPENEEPAHLELSPARVSPEEFEEETEETSETTSQA